MSSLLSHIGNQNYVVKDKFVDWQKICQLLLTTTPWIQQIDGS